MAKSNIEHVLTKIFQCEEDLAVCVTRLHIFFDAPVQLEGNLRHLFHSLNLVLWKKRREELISQSKDVREGLEGAVKEFQRRFSKSNMRRFAAVIEPGGEPSDDTSRVQKTLEYASKETFLKLTKMQLRALVQYDRPNNVLEDEYPELRNLGMVRLRAIERLEAHFNNIHSQSFGWQRDYYLHCLDQDDTEVLKDLLGDGKQKWED
ncbi:hypothetical protein T440DRAFT_483981 [Plenodomus tracheiphilus IPT5]|uniref:Uncharacterized protein n=1 Tax=Plenodomus tracheiphilus IPT5 TaxID=1408161 RepID=A0A6A7ANT3_9PLEO|nr:hypothetical protein T440DRAFT_483981 [Plenodomus tracheiphilus IPT5]